MRAKRGAKPNKIDGLPVIDATEDLLIHISKHDVSISRKKDPEHCAAAMACRRILRRDVKVHMSRIYIKDSRNKRWVRYITPESIAREITAFDRGAVFEPGTYKFNAPKESQRLGHYHRGGHKTGKGKKHIKLHFTANVRRKGSYDA